MMNFLGAMIVILSELSAGQQASQHPVVIVEEPREVRLAVGVRIDGTFTPSQDEAEAPRRDLARYLETERRLEKRDDRQYRLRRIGLALDRYFWHCAGYASDGQKYLFYSFVRFSPSQLLQLRRKTFPVIYDGGIAVCRCYFSMETGRIVRLEWNGEA